MSIDYAVVLWFGNKGPAKMLMYSRPGPHLLVTFEVVLGTLGGET